MSRSAALQKAGVVVMVFETEHFTSWKCAVCHIWRDRTYPARITQTGTKVVSECREHPDTTDEDGTDCGCHCHESNYCEECGERSW